jgi:T4 superinfection immunity protein
MHNSKQIYDAFMQIWPLLYAVMLLGLFFWPTVMAFHRRHPFPVAIAFWNFAIGWTGLGWLYLMWKMWTWPKPRY